jgi:hypothetical protein
MHGALLVAEAEKGYFAVRGALGVTGREVCCKTCAYGFNGRIAGETGKLGAGMRSSCFPGLAFGDTESVQGARVVAREEGWWAEERGC